jgi:23S rRNA pseudouridine1911/1915/1917 synthase
MQFPEIIFENEDFIALNKPAGMLSIPDREQSQPSLKDMLINRLGSIFTVHRLDKDTSGIIIFAKTAASHQWLNKQFEARETKKIYGGLVQGKLAAAQGTVSVPIIEHPGKNGSMVTAKKGKEAVTDFEVLEEFGQYSWVQFRIHTGRTHQIRVHAKYLGHPIVCDPVYGNAAPVLLSSLKKHFNLSKKEEEERPILQRQALHALQLSFTDPDGKVYTLEAPLAKDLRALMQQLRKWKR